MAAKVEASMIPQCHAVPYFRSHLARIRVTNLMIKIKSFLHLPTFRPRGME